MLEEIGEKAVNLNIDLEPRRKKEPREDSDSDSDFVEVTPKDDFEAEARADDTLLGIPFYPQGTLGTAEPQPGTSGKQRNETGSWKVFDGEATDPTTFAATLAKLKVGTEFLRLVL